MWRNFIKTEYSARRFLDRLWEILSVYSMYTETQSNVLSNQVTTSLVYKTPRLFHQLLCGTN